MKLFRTEISPDALFPDKINWQNQFISLGSCFADKVAQYFDKKGLNILSNPSGVLYNPQSIADLLQNSLKNKQWNPPDLLIHKDQSFLPFIQGSPENPLEFIQKVQDQTRGKLQSSSVLFITFGSAVVYQLKSNDHVVANCHKLPKELFHRKMLDTDEIIHSWSQLVKNLQNLNPQLKIVFTVSPIRHLRDNYRENQVSKSTLHLAIEKIIKQHENCFYFPSYEIMMDDLRDYRFYEEDMTHPNKVATEYILQKFIESAFDPASLKYFLEAEKITKMIKHRLLDQDSLESLKFIESRQKKIEAFQVKYPSSLI
ncbi:GSCFA domain-containing protein [Lentisphaera profundi]|uniref:GSCFA domain-containing protein n=1 Tax=Lentisphaera profundi TaxID=1658616 RepID=A0ABY7VUM7_9BACT|nr:GSCFA domain-containing protein [Lentisphaera profundi]WDE97004.1 GSCFA domain-containing protein [Lentisphaera profundi]